VPAEASHCQLHIMRLQPGLGPVVPPSPDKGAASGGRGSPVTPTASEARGWPPCTVNSPPERPRMRERDEGPSCGIPWDDVTRKLTLSQRVYYIRDYISKARDYILLKYKLGHSLAGEIHNKGYKASLS
jgi:hypothetical protein